MKLGEPGATYLSLPPNMQSPENFALGMALDKQMKKLMEFNSRLLIWPDLESLSPKYYDYAAASLRTLYYSSNYDEETRLEILKNALKTYVNAGSVRAVEDLLKDIFQEATFVPWYEYGGKPYHFKIIASTDLSEDDLKKFMEILDRVKAQRSIIDMIETPHYTIDMHVYMGVGITGYEKIQEKGGR